MKYAEIQWASKQPIYYVGRDLSEGPLPALFYFALSAEESLHTDPYNQMPSFLSSLPLRIFSMDLPVHGKNLPAIQAFSVWAENFRAGKDLITPFLDDVVSGISKLEEKGILKKEMTGVAGLSRGALIATHVAARIPKIPSILGFAPVTELSFSKEFQELSGNPLVQHLNLIPLIDHLTSRHLRFYIGNRDLRVGTAKCFHFIQTLVDAAFEKKERSSQVELIIGPSIGQLGHGTSKAVFEEGARWMAKELGVL
jgi:esterase FrsA